MVNDLGVFSLNDFLFFGTPLRETKQSVSSSIGFALAIIDSKMVLGEFLSPTNLFRAQVFCIHELTKVVIVGQYKDFVFITFKIMAPGLESFNNS